MIRRLKVLATVMLCLAYHVVGQAATTNYGDFVGASVTYVDVTEGSGTDPVPLFGPPTVSGNTLDFDPVSFNSFSEDGGFDQTDGTLRFSIEAKDGQFIDKLKLEEAGDFTLLGLGGAPTFAQASVLGFLVEIDEVDGIPIDPIKISLDPQVFASVNLADDGNGQIAQDIWTGEIVVDITDQLDVPFERGATRVGVIFDNSLVTLSEEGTSSLIAKKDNGVRITVFPEPSSVMLLLLGCAAIVPLIHRRYR